MNIYDFDNTIFKGDSSVKFIKYSLVKHPFLVLRSTLKSIPCLVKCLFQPKNFGTFKGIMFSFVIHIPNFDEYLDEFIEKNIHNIKNFYLERKMDSDVIISASFDFIIEPFCQKLGIKNVIATKYDLKKGCIVGKNCKAEEKVNRFLEVFPKAIVNEAYSDSLTDKPMFSLAKKAYMVKDEELIVYNK